MSLNAEPALELRMRNTALTGVNGTKRWAGRFLPNWVVSPSVSVPLKKGRSAFLFSGKFR